jgi:ATP-dependent exoDNAse (exonuclease V) alpha subunit
MPLLPEDDNIKQLSDNKRTIIQNLDCIVIDEISMVRADILAAVDYSLRINGGNRKKIFGGKQIIFVGDPFQLEPVTKSTPEEANILNENYPEGLYFFDAKPFWDLDPEVVELKKIYRQADDNFLQILNRVRSGEQTDLDLERINLNYNRGLVLGEYTVELCSTNTVAEQRNNLEINRLNQPEFVYSAKIEGKFETTKAHAPLNLRLRVGAQVMFVKNDFNKKFINGTLAKVTRLTKEKIWVKTEDGEEIEVMPDIWDSREFKFNRSARKIDVNLLGRMTQFPLKLAWSITIHKSQGLTFEKVYLNFGSGAFAAGQAYVALSRCKSLDGLQLRSGFRHSDIIIEPRVLGFLKIMRQREKTEKQLF